MNIDITGILSGVDKLLATVEQAQDAGLDAGAVHLQTVDRATAAYNGMSGAMRASTFAASFGPGYDGKASAAYQAAAGLLNGFTGHAGQPHLEDSGTAPDTKGIGLSSAVDYGEAVEVDNAGAKAHLGPTIFSEAQEVTRIVASHLKAKVG